MVSNINYPFDYDDFLSPQPGDYEDIIAHSGQHTQHNQVAEAIEHYVGRINEADTNTLTGKANAHYSDLTQHASGRVLGDIDVQSNIVVTGGTYTGSPVPGAPVAISALTLGIRVASRPFFLVLSIAGYENSATAGGEFQYLTPKDITSGSPVAVSPESWKSLLTTTGARTAFMEWGPFVAPASDRIYRMYWTHTNPARNLTMYGRVGDSSLPAQVTTMYAREA
jgi:hypothetical protein